jgi:hypothetical protein
MQRRELLAALGLLAFSLPFAGSARAAGLGSKISDLLGQASDSSLDRLAQPGAFYNDPAIRIALPLIGGGLGKGLGSALDFGQKLGVGDNIVRKLNDAAGAAAKEAKPIFRNAIGSLSLSDVPGIATQNDGATQYLQRSAGTELRGKLLPLVDSALLQAGAFKQIDKLAKTSSLLRKAGLSREKVGGSVTDQALSGIFKYIGDEEGRLRANPLGAAGGLLKGLLGN